MKKVGIVGLGFIGKTHLEAFRHIQSAEVTTVCTKSVKPDEVDLSNYDFTTDYDELLLREDIDIIDICVPSYLHEEYIVKAARAKKHIICEKPLSLSVASVKRIYEEVEKCGVRLFIGHVLRFWPEYQAIKSYSETENLRNIEVIHAQRLGELPSWSNWFQHPKKSGGVLFDLHLHDIDFSYYLLGEVDHVYAVGTQNKNGAWNHIMTTLTFNNGAKAFVEASQRMPTGYPFSMAFRAQTPTNTLEFQLKAGENIESIENSKLILFENEKLSEVNVKKADAFQKELSYFVKCIESGQKNTIVPLEDVLYVIELLEAINLSLETGHVVHI